MIFHNFSSFVLISKTECVCERERERMRVKKREFKMCVCSIARFTCCLHFNLSVLHNDFVIRFLLLLLLHSVLLYLLHFPQFLLTLLSDHLSISIIEHSYFIWIIWLTLTCFLLLASGKWILFTFSALLLPSVHHRFLAALMPYMCVHAFKWVTCMCTHLFAFTWDTSMTQNAISLYLANGF